MITKKQKWLLGGLVPLCGAIWVPQFIGGGGRGDTSAQLAIDGPTEAEMVEMNGGAGPGFEGGFDGGGSASPTARPSATAAHDVPLGGPDATVGGTASRAVAGPESTALAVLNALRSAEAFGAPGAKDAPHRSSDPRAPRPGGDAEVDADTTNAMLAFVAKNPLRGTLTGAKRRVALLGSYRLEAGARVPGTSATVTSIERGLVTLDDGEMSIELDLPPLETDPARARRRAAGDGSGRPGSADLPLEPDSEASLEDVPQAAPVQVSAPMEDDQ